MKNKNRIHITASGEEIRFKDLQINHLQNIINKLKKDLLICNDKNGIPVYSDEDEKLIHNYEKELNRRTKKIKEFPEELLSKVVTLKEIVQNLDSLYFLFIPFQDVKDYFDNINSKNNDNTNS